MQGPEVASFIIMLRYAVPRLLDPPKVPSSVVLLYKVRFFPRGCPGIGEHNRIERAAAMLARASAKMKHSRASRWHSPIAIRQPTPSRGRCLQSS